MPAIRDFAQNYVSNISSYLVCSCPTYQENDLLICQSTCDTGATPLRWAFGEAPTKLWQYTQTGAVYTAYETNTQTPSNWYMTPSTITAAGGDCCYIGHNNIFNGWATTISTGGAGTQTWVWEYWNGAWVTLTTIVNVATPHTATPGPKGLVFNPPTDWTTTSVNGVTCYWIRMRQTNTSATQTTRPVYTRAGVCFWNQLASSTNSTTAHTSFSYKIAGASEPSEYVVAECAATSDTKNSVIISIRDVDTNIPLAHGTETALNNSETTQDSDLSLYSGSVIGAAQSFASPSTAYRMASVKFYLKKYGSPTGNITVNLYAHDGGTLASTGLPTGISLAASNTYNIANLTTSYQLIEFTFPWYYQYWFTATTNYQIAVQYSGGDSSNYLQVGYDNSSPGHAGHASTLSGSTWTAQSYDLCFYVYYFTFATNTNATGRFALPTMTTARDNSLVLYSQGCAAASVPSIIEGPVSLLTAKDGSNHADACSWGFQKTAGTTPSDVYLTALGTAWTHTTLVCAVNPPSDGADVIPAYCVSDASLYISPLTGAAFLSDSAPVTTVTTDFGTTLNGITLQAAATTITYTDTGVNSYHAMLALTSITIANTWAGLRQVISSRNLSGKNILLHVQPYRPIDIQTTDSVALTGGACGIAFGLCSTSNTHYKVYHVGGAFSSWGIQRHAPIIVNTDYTGAGVIQNTGTLAPGAVTSLGFFISARVAIAVWLFGSMWLLDTTVVAGGNVAEPLDISGIVRAVADGHERRSVIKQGSSQFMIFQPIQIGNGGTNPVYLELDATALEFPQQYSKTDKNVAYLSVDNVCGLKYYGGSSDTIIHRNSVISSKSRYFWGLHSSHSTSCNPDFSGLSVIGAGTITLARAVTITELTINDYITIDASGLTLTYSSILGCPTGNDSLTLTTGSNIDYCEINVTGVSSGNRLCSITDPTIFSYCTFTGSGSSGHAMRLTSTGTYNIYGLTFTGFGADGTNYAAIFNDSGGLITLNVLGGGNTPTIRNGTSASTVVNNNIQLTITGLVTGSDIVVYAAGTTTVLDDAQENSGTTWIYTYAAADAGDEIDVGVFLVGYRPFYIRNYTLASSDSSLPVAQETDRAYLT